MGETAFENNRISDFQRLVTYRRASVVDLYLHTKFRWRQRNFLWTDGQTDVRTGGRTFETHFIRLDRLGGVDLINESYSKTTEVKWHHNIFTQTDLVLWMLLEISSSSKIFVMGSASAWRRFISATTQARFSFMPTSRNSSKIAKILTYQYLFIQLHHTLLYQIITHCHIQVSGRHSGMIWQRLFPILLYTHTLPMQTLTFLSTLRHYSLNKTQLLIYVHPVSIALVNCSLTSHPNCHILQIYTTRQACIFAYSIAY